MSTSNPDDEIDYLPPPDNGLDLIHADEDLVVVAKPAGLLSVPGRGAARADCMASRVQARFADALTVHRLDMATSGLLVFGRGPDVQRTLSIAFAGRDVRKRYEALVHGLVQVDQGEIDLPLITDWPRRPRQMVCFERGKPSLTRFRVIDRDAQSGTTRVSLEPVTGRSHQLRVHLMALGHPIVGDPLYGADADAGPALGSGAPRATRLMLHAAELGLPHPRDGHPQSWLSQVPF
ncbi:MAG: RNA pseudouridine synthase [Burkholderiales bacterium RIFCSPHIGHO2_01_FULL_63_240]|jgi:tRNA pseudouridine32 synthase / 23S rRNA pseudouridine746 synthase|nr:MAG: RNA pseudouridine synthase [Burkholderiales bacterium RIFCSPHIGHO2_01_FULL_63_240]